MDNKFVTKFLWFLKPLVLWIDHTFSIPFTKKKVTGHEFYIWQKNVKKGQVFVTDAKGHGSNLINPSEGKHGAIYFGTGLKTEMEEIIINLMDMINVETDKSKKAEMEVKLVRLNAALSGISDDIPYVIEAVEAGVIATDFVSFLTSKDRVRGLVLNKGFGVLDVNAIMCIAAESAVHDLGLGYDYGFATSDTEKYCFEVVIDAYQFVVKDIDLQPKLILNQKFYTADAFWNSKDFDLVMDSDSI